MHAHPTVVLEEAQPLKRSYERSERIYGEMLDMARQAGDESMAIRALYLAGSSSLAPSLLMSGPPCQFR